MLPHVPGRAGAGGPIALEHELADVLAVGGAVVLTEQR